MEEYKNESNEPIKSMNSLEKAYVRFINKTESAVDIIWLDFEGNEQRYKILRSMTFVDIDTFKTHPWIAKNVKNGERMLIDFKNVYMPITYKDHLLQNPNLKHPIIDVSLRKKVFVTLPLRTLKYICLLIISNMLHAKEDVDHLFLPLQIKGDLKHLLP